MIRPLTRGLLKSLIRPLISQGDIQNNTWLFDDGSAMLWDDNSNVLF